MQLPSTKINSTSSNGNLKQNVQKNTSQQKFTPQSQTPNINNKSDVLNPVSTLVPSKSQESDLFGDLDIIDTSTNNFQNQMTTPSTNIEKPNIPTKDNDILSVEELSKLSSVDQITLAFSLTFQQQTQQQTQQQQQQQLSNDNNSNNMSAFDFISSNDNENDKNHVEGNASATIQEIRVENENNSQYVEQQEGISAFSFISDSQPAQSNNENVDNDNDKQVPKVIEKDIFHSSMETINNNITEPYNQFRYEASATPPNPAKNDNTFKTLYDASIMGQLQRTNDEFEYSRKEFWNSMKQFLEKEKRIKQREIQLQQKLEEENKKLKEFETNKQQALMKENFEEADRIRNSITRGQNNIADIESHLSRQAAELIGARKDKSRIEQKLFKKTEKLKEKLTSLYQTHDEQMQKYVDDEHNRIEKEESEIHHKLEKIEEVIVNTNENINKCETSLEKIEDKIYQNTFPIQQELSTNEIQQKKLEEEIKYLKEQLEAKTNELNSIQNTIKKLNEKNDDARKSFAKEIENITQQKNVHITTKDQNLHTKQELENKLTDLQQQSVNVEENEKKYANELIIIQNKINESSNVLTQLNDSELYHRQWEENNTLLTNTLKTLQKSFENTKNEITKFQTESNMAETRKKHYQTIIDSCEIAIPKLQNEKSEAVSNENYLEAGRIHNQIKAKEEQKQKALTDLQETSNKRAEFDSQVRQLIEKQTSIEEELGLTLTKIDRLRFELLTHCRITISKQLAQLTEDTNNNNKNTNKSAEIESNVLQSELDQYNEELTALSKQHGWKIDDVATQQPIQNVEPTNNTNTKQIDESTTISKSDSQSIETKNASEIEAELNNEKLSHTQIEKELIEIKQQIQQAVNEDRFDIAKQLQPKKKELENKIKSIVEKIEKLQTQLNSMNIDNNNISNNKNTSNEILNRNDDHADNVNKVENNVDNKQISQNKSDQENFNVEKNEGDMFSGMNVDTATENQDITEID